jgi:hypothetical protein
MIMNSHLGPIVPQPTVNYYKTIEHAAPYLPSNIERYGFDYKGFKISKINSEYMLWSISTLENALAPPSLRSSFTTADKARAQVDAFWEAEKAREEANKTNA